MRTRSTTASLTALFVATATLTATAAPRHVLVLRAEGNADATTRGNVDQEVAKLAKTLDGNIEIGEITFADAAAAVGCTGSEAQCRDDVLGMMGVDELVATSVTAMPSGDLRILVHRIPKGAPTKNAQTTVTSGQPLAVKLDNDVGPMFGVKPKPASTPPVVTASTPATPGMPAGTATTPEPGPTMTPPPVVTTSSTPPAGAPTGAWGNEPATRAQGAPLRTAQVDPNSPGGVTAAPNGVVQLDERQHSRATTGLAIGGGLVVLSVILWAEAGSVQGDINNAPVRTPTDFKNLQDLESKADAYSGLGNLCFLGGLVVGGISGYFFWKDRRAHSASMARLTPTVFDHGAGLAFTYGGLP